MIRRNSFKIESEPIALSYEARSGIPGQRPGNWIAILTLLIAGTLIWLAIGGGRGIGGLRWGIIAVATALGFTPPVAKLIEAVRARLRGPSPRSIKITSILIAIVSAGYFILTAVLQDRDLFPKTHDDCSYLIQMQMLARGRLWMGALPLPDFFDSFYILVRPVYASQYFPGTALLYVPTIWLGLPMWMMPVLAAGAVVGLTYRILAELIDGAAGALGAVWMVSLSWFRMASILLMSQVPALLFGLLMIWGWLRWRRSRRSGWLLLIGVAAGWAAITRPVDAICFAVPVGIALLADLIKSNSRQWIATGALLIVGAAPFLGLQLVFDKGVTGHYFQTPFRLYLDRDVPGTQFGFPAENPAARPQSSLLQKQEYYFNWARPYIERHRPGQLVRSWVDRWFPLVVDTTLPARVMLPLTMVGLWGLIDRRRWVLFGAVPLFAILYAFYPIFLEHYAIALMPAAAMLCLLSIEAIGNALPAFRRSAMGALTALIVITCASGFWEINRLIAPAGRQVEDETFRSPMLRQINRDIPNAPDLKRPAVFLFRYRAGGNYFEEPVYNTDVAWPDDAPIIRAHDLGPRRDREIVAYYAAQKPAREFYLFDPKAPEAIKDLGSTDAPRQILENLDRAEPAVK